MLSHPPYSPDLVLADFFFSNFWINNCVTMDDSGLFNHSNRL
jgi:hypothetical protein